MTDTKQFLSLYKQAEERAVECGAGFAGNGGKAFLKEDRAALVAKMWEMKQTPNQLGYAIGKLIGNTARHVTRLRSYQEQVEKGVIRLAPAATGEHVGQDRTPVKVVKPSEDAFDGRIKNVNDVQPAFNRAARQLIKVGITSPEQAFKYVTAAFATARVEQKIDLKAERIVKELQLGDLSKTEVMLTLERVKQLF